MTYVTAFLFVLDYLSDFGAVLYNQRARVTLDLQFCFIIKC